MPKGSLCVCQSGRLFSKCCQPFIDGSLAADSALALMRSRYTAYSLGHFDYLKATCAEDALILFEADEPTVPFNGVRLDILSTEEYKDWATIEFNAYYHKKGSIYYHHETSTFKRIYGKWFYVSARIME